jgi:ADP-ribose pyrophosphatase YjhB (NUDIX family)
LSYLRVKDIERVEKKYGKPVELTTQITATAKELEAVRRSQKHDRAHDITLFIVKANKLLFIAKHFYPSGLFRAPSGGAKRGESIIEGGKREAFEETGVKIEFEKYLLRIKAKFVSNDDSIDWTSHVFKAKYISGEVDPRDKKEIREARFVGLDEIERFTEIMGKINSAGFRYRVFLTQNTMKLLEKEIVSKRKKLMRQHLNSNG